MTNDYMQLWISGYIRTDGYYIYRAAIFMLPVCNRREDGEVVQDSREKSHGENLCSQNSPVGSFADYPRVTDRTARGQSKQVVSLHFARSEEARKKRERERIWWPWAIARRFDHKTRSYGYLKTYWPAHARARGRGRWRTKVEKERQPWPSRDKSKDIKIVPPPRFARPSRFRSQEGRRGFLAECITERQRAVIKLSVIPRAGYVIPVCICLFYVLIGDKRERNRGQFTGSGEQSGTLINEYWISRESPSRALQVRARKRFIPPWPLWI